MNMHTLKIFYHVARLGSVTQAAKILMISQPAVTIQIRKLEKELGLVLFTLRGRKIFLTDAGEMLSYEAKRLFALEQEIETHI
jgi:DNA-binding transcriptional LysR family regulator